MARGNNYQIQARQAKDLFLTYDQGDIIRKFNLQFDETYLYLPMLGSTYRIHRKTGAMERRAGEDWLDGNSHGEVMSILDLLCDSREDRHLSGRLKAMSAFGLQFHQNLLEDRDPWAEKFERQPEGFRRACQALGGKPMPIGDIAYSIEVFDGLAIVAQLWLGDEEFPANLRWLWDENALQYIRYETMYYVVGVLLRRLAEEMD